MTMRPRARNEQSIGSPSWTQRLFSFLKSENIKIVTRDSTSFPEPAPRPCVFRCKNGEPHRNHNECRPWQNQQGNANQQDGCSNHGDDYAFNVVSGRDSAAPRESRV